MKAYYFDTVPVHPEPGYFESLTSYLTRLAQANGLATMTRLFKLCFPSGPVQLSFQTGDFPPASFGELSTLTQCPEPRLWSTTFYHLGKKFNRVLQARPLAQFLSGSITYGFLRYCPLCLAEQGYYSLLWRFLAVEGCPTHGCRLWEACGHCGQRLPLLAPLPKLGFCPTCGGDLKTCPVERLSDNLHQSLAQRWADLSYLVSPQACELEGLDLTEVIGQRLAAWRRARHLKAVDITRHLELSTSALGALEANRGRSLTKFRWYVEYAQFLQVSLQDIFTGRLDFPAQPTKVEQLIQQLEAAVVLLDQQGQPVNQQTIAQLLKVSPSIFRRYPQVRAWWKAYKTDRKQQRDAELANRAQQAIAQLRQEGQKVSRLAVCKRIGLTFEGLRLFYPAVWAIVDAQSDYARQQPRGQPQPSRAPRPQYQREDELLGQVEQAIQNLQQQGQSVSLGKIGTLVGIAGPALYYYPRVKALLQARDRQPRGQNEDELCEKVETALATLIQAGDPVTAKAVSQLVGVSSSTLNYYPRVRDLLNRQIKQKYQVHRCRQRQQREAELVRKVTAAIELLQASQAEVTQKAVCEIVQMSSVNLKRYPKVKLLLAQVTGLSDSTRLLALQRQKEP